MMPEEIFPPVGLHTPDELLAKFWDPEYIRTGTYEEIIRDAALLLSQVTLTGRIMAAGSFLHRARASPGEADFEYVHQLSYREDLKNIRDRGRVNAPHEAIFYCSSTIPICIAEVLHFHGMSHTTRRFSVGTWRTTRPLLFFEAVWGSDDRARFVDDLSSLIARIHDWWDFYFRLEPITVEPYKVTNAVAAYAFARGCDGIAYRTVKLPHMSVFLHNIDSERPRLEAPEDKLVAEGLAYRVNDLNFAVRPETVRNSMCFVGAKSFEMTHRGGGEYYQTKVRKAQEAPDGRLYWSEEA